LLYCFSYDAHFLVRDLEVEGWRGQCHSKRRGEFHQLLKVIRGRQGTVLGLLQVYVTQPSLVSFLRPQVFVHTSKHFPADKMEVVTRKGVFCYDYVDKFNG
jgi:hypothetical protein